LALCTQGELVLNLKGKLLLVIASGIATFTAIAHLSCLYFGPKCYELQLAPNEVFQSAIDGTWLAPIGNIFISSLFLLCACYALSGADIIRKFPFLKLGINTIATICILRGIVILPLSFIYPERTTTVSVVAGITWFVTGLLFFYGYRYALRTST